MLPVANLSRDGAGMLKWEFVKGDTIDLHTAPPLPDRSPESLKLELALQGVLSALSPTQRAAVDGPRGGTTWQRVRSWRSHSSKRSIRPAEISQAQSTLRRLRNETMFCSYMQTRVSASSNTYESCAQC